MALVPGDYLWCRHSVQYFLACYKEKSKKSTDTLAAQATLMGIGLSNTLPPSPINPYIRNSSNRVLSDQFMDRNFRKFEFWF